MTTLNFFTAILAAIIAGITIAAQTAIETRFKQTLGSIVPVGVIAFGTAFVILLAYCCVKGINPVPDRNLLTQTHWYQYFGGFFRITYLLLFVYACLKIGNAYTTCFLVAAQIAAAALIDAHGLFGVARLEWTTQKTIGACLLVAGVYFSMPNKF